MATEEFTRRVEDLLEEVLDLSPAEQQAVLAQRRAEEPEICTRVEVLLAQARPAFLNYLPLVLPVEEWFPPDEPRMAPGTRLADFEIEQEIGRGGMAVVYRARQLGLNRVVALKMILTGAFASPEEVRRFRIEAEAVARLHHPNIVQIHAIGEHEGLPFLALEYLDGGTLSARLDGRPLPPQQAAQLTETLAQAVEHAHERGIVHLDLKPDNVLLQMADRRSPGDQPPSATGNLQSAIAKITDFGLARMCEKGVPTATRSGVIRGTPSYMAPEQAKENKTREIGPCSDVYALGAILYELLTGRPPFRAATSLETLELVCTQEAVPPRQLQPKVPRDLETICLKCLDKEPAKRYATAAELADDLHRFREGQPIKARRIGVVGRGWRWCRRKPVVASLTAAVGLLVLVLAVGGPVWAVREGRLRAAADSEKKRAELLLAVCRRALQVPLSAAQDRRLQQMGLLDVVRDLLQKAQPGYEQVLQLQGEDENVLVSKGLAANSLVVIYRLLGKTDQALATAEEAEGLFKVLAARTNAPQEARFGLAVALFQRGVFLGQKQDRTAEAVDLFTQAALLFGALLAEGVENAAECRFQLGICRNNLANCYRVSDPATAVRFYEQAIAEFRELCKEAPQEGRARDWLVRSQSNLALVLEQAGRTTEALARHREAVRQGREFVNLLEDALRTNRDLDRWAPYELDHRESLAIALNNQAEILTRLRRRDEAERSFREALPQYQELARRVPLNPEYPWSVAMTRTNLGVVLSEGPPARWTEAEEHFHAAAQWYKPAYEGASEDLELARYWAANRAGFAGLKARQAFAAATSPDDAINLYAEAIRILEKAKASPETRPLIAENLVRLGTVQRRSGRLAESATALTRAQELVKPLPAEVSQGPGVGVLRAMAEGQLGKVFVRRGRRDDAQRLLNDAAARLDTLMKEYPEDQSIRDAHAENAFLRAGLAASDANEAMRLLRAAAAQGLFQDVDRVRELETDEDLAPLRSRKDLKELIEKARGAKDANPRQGASLPK